MRRRTLLAADLLVAIAALLWLDGWLPDRGGRAASAPPPELARALGAVSDDLKGRAKSLAENAEVARSLEGGGIAIQRQTLFAAAREIMTGAPPGSWIALADPDGTVLAWWGEAPSRMPAPPRTGSVSVRWSATRMEVAHWRVAGSGAFSGVICAARSLPAEAPGFAAALGLGGEAATWDPIAAEAGRPVLLGEGGRALVSARRAEPLPPVSRSSSGGAALALLILAALPLLAAGPIEIGLGLGVLFLGSVAASAAAPRSLTSATVWILSAGPMLLPPALARLHRREPARSASNVAAGFVLLAVGIFEARGADVPGLVPGLSFPSAPFFELMALTAVFGAALAFGASGGGRPRRGATGMAIFVTAATLLGGLAFVSHWPLFPAAIAAGAVVAYELWRRSIAGAGPRGTLGPFRLTAAAEIR